MRSAIGELVIRLLVKILMFFSADIFVLMHLFINNNFISLSCGPFSGY